MNPQPSLQLAIAPTVAGHGHGSSAAQLSNGLSYSTPSEPPAAPCSSPIAEQPTRELRAQARYAMDVSTTHSTTKPVVAVLTLHASWPAQSPSRPVHRLTIPTRTVEAVVSGLSPGRADAVARFDERTPGDRRVGRLRAGSSEQV